MNSHKSICFELFDSEREAVAAVADAGLAIGAEVQPDYASQVPRLVVREIGTITLVKLRPKNPACDEPLETGRQLRQLVTEFGNRRIVLDLLGVDTTSSALNGALFAFAHEVGLVKGRLALCNMCPRVREIFDLILKTVNEWETAMVDRNCEQCGSPIRRDRLRALPNAIRCWHCQTAIEQAR